MKPHPQRRLQLPGKLGTYLGLVGTTIRAADAVWAGLADLNIGTEAPSDLEALAPAINEHFAHDSVEATRVGSAWT